MRPMNAIPNRHQDRHVVVTGAGTGIGRAIALRLWAEGARLTLLARTHGRLEETAALCRELRAGGEDDLGLAGCDVRERAALDAALAAGAESRGPLFACIANAGIGGPNEDGPDDRFEDLVATNLTGTYHTFRAALRHLADASTGPRHLVSISSILARFGVPGYTGYCASKTGLLGLVRALAHEFAAEEVQVNAVCPGWVDTQMARDGIEGMAEGMGTSFEEARAIAMAAVPMRRMSEPEDIAGLVSWLLSSDARGVTGQGLDMNGGAWM